MTSPDELADNLAWLSDLNARRAVQMRNPTGLRLNAPQCDRRCPRCTLDCAMTIFMVGHVEQLVRDAGGGTVH